MTAKPKYSFARFAYMFAAGFCLGTSVHEFTHHQPVWGIVFAALGVVMIIYRLYHPTMFLRKS